MFSKRKIVTRKPPFEIVSLGMELYNCCTRHGSIDVEYPASFKTSAEESRLFPTRLLAMEETQHTLTSDHTLDFGMP